LLREVEKIAGETFPRAIRLESLVPGDLPLVECDATQIHQVLLNLCVNARDAMPDGGSLRIEADEFEVDEFYASMTPQARKGRYVRICVADSGSGISPEVLEQIFDPFFTTKPIGKGTGLGLSTAVGIVRSHDGFIEVQSEVGKGATFAIFLPSLSTGALLPDSQEDPSGPVGQGQLILVVDDECAIRNVTESVLARNGYRTLAAADGAQAITIFAAQFDRIDAVFTDVLMPEVDGLALCRVLRKIDPTVRILAASGSSEDGRLRELRAMNIGEVLNKPFSTDSLLSALAETLNARQGAFLS
jgi:CheY-like chemotaxis protein